MPLDLILMDPIIIDLMLVSIDIQIHYISGLAIRYIA